MKKRSWLMALCLVLTVAVSISSTLAYLTSQDGDVNVMTVGNVKIQQNEQDRKGNDFQQGQMLLPMVGDTSKKDELGYPAAENYIDKIVTVTNTGSTTAWVRTLIAIPQFEYAEHDGTNASTNVLHWNGYSQGDGKDTGYPAADLLPGTDTRVDNNWFWGVEGDKAWPGNGGNWNLVDDVDVNGKKYSVYIITNMAIVEPGETTAPNLIGVYLDSQVDYDHSKGVYTYNGEAITGLNESVEVLVLSQAVQAGGFDTAWDAFDAAFALGEDPAVTVAGWLDAMISDEVVVKSSEEFAAAVEAEKENIVIYLDSDVTYDVTAWDALGLGSDVTESVTIIGNGHTLTFNHKNSDWNNVVTDNGATLSLVDLHLTNSGYNNGPWNRHDINFGCNVQMTNVTSDKCIALKAGGQLENVSITDEGDIYALWIQPNGQTVTIDGLTVKCARGIKIDEQYVEDAKLVKLSVKDAKFETTNKAAIIVKSVAGADITLENVDITKCAKDSTNAVWVDEASAAHFDKVTVTGGSVVQE